MRKITLVLCLLLISLFVFGTADANAARKPMDRDKAIISLQNSFQYDSQEIAKYLDSGLSYMEVKNICLHAYAANKPISEVAGLREKYGWIRVKYLLGLTPEKFAQREMDYKAERLERLFGLDKKLAMKYMKNGYAAHSVKRAMFIATHCNKSVEEILAMKTRQIKWPEICVKLGLPKDACMHAADK